MLDYLAELLNNRKTYAAKISLLKKHQDLFHDPDEFERFAQIERDLAWLDSCIEQLDPQHREIIEQLYIRGFSMGQLGKAMHISKSGIQTRKRMAMRKLRAIFDIKA